MAANAMTLDEAREAYEAAKAETEKNSWWRLDALTDAAADLIAALEADNAAQQARISELERKLAAVEAVADKDYIPWMTDYARQQNSEWTKKVYEGAWGNGAHVVQTDILIALGIMQSAEEWLARQRADDVGTADGEATND